MNALELLTVHGDSTDNAPFLMNTPPQISPPLTLSHPLSFRYTPDDYPSEAEWQGRQLVETSNAAKCPTVAYQLAGGNPQDIALPPPPW